MKVLHVTPSLAPALRYGGPAIAVYEEALALGENGVDVTVLTTDSDGPGRRLNVNKIVQPHSNVTLIYSRKLSTDSMSIEFLRRLPSLIRQADVVVLSAVYNFTTFPTLAVAKRYRKPLIWWVHGALDRWEGSRRVRSKTLWNLIARRLLPSKTIIRVATNEEIEACRLAFPGVPTLTIPCPVAIPPDSCTPSRGTQRPLRILFLSRLDRKKGIEVLLAACAKLSFEWSLEIAGDGDRTYADELKDLVATLGVNTKVRFLGHVTGEMKEAAFQRASVFALSSFTENFGIAVAEALMRGLPVAVSSRIPWREVNTVGCGVVADPTPESFAGALMELNQSDLQAMGRRGRAWALANFASSTVIEKTLTSYRLIAGGDVASIAAA
jgi:glycosyltransferase involved in cell wall biosynthesis